jgi:chaperonin cofactor prefoldin
MKESKAKEVNITSADIKKSLESRHQKDFYLTEVKTGSTWFDKFYKIDAMAMAKSWRNPKVTMYEIKVNRNDFLRDQKYQNYFAFCHEFYFACIPDLIQRDEIDAHAGLIYSTGKSNRIIKKALYREQQIPSEIFQYIIMNRINENPYPFFNDKIEYFEAWLQRKTSTKELSCRIKSEIINRIASLEDIKEECEKIKNDQKNLKEILKSYGTYVFDNRLTDALERLLKEQKIVKFNPQNVLRQIDRSIETLSEIKEGLIENE